MAVLDAVLAVFTAIAGWVSDTLPTIQGIFWTAGTSGNPGSLTFMGVLAVAGLAISVFFLLMGVIQNFLHFRG